MEQLILFAFLVLFPFGQIIKIGILNPIDVIVGVGALIALIRKYKRPEVFKHFQNFLLISLFSFILGSFIFRSQDLVYGFLYFLRLSAYFYFFVFVWNFVKEKKSNIDYIKKAFLLVFLVTALFGWIQYFTFPDLKPFTIYGWDEHLYRIVGTFLDPTFTSLIFVFGTVLSLFMFTKTKEKRYLAASLFFLISLAFTYSRAGYLALFVALIFYWMKTLKTKLVLVLFLLTLSFIIFLPRKGGEGVNLSRINSVVARVVNYKETLSIIKTSPIFGVGFNNICLARQKYIDFDTFDSHACSGSDSSILFILATTGIVGLFSFLYLISHLWRQIDDLSKTFLISLFVHSLFSNSVFYPWIMGVILIFVASGLRSKVKS